MKATLVIRLIVLLVSGIITLSSSFAFKKKADGNADKMGKLVTRSDNNISCTAGSGDECYASDCEAPAISTGCDNEEEDNQTTVNEVTG